MVIQKAERYPKGDKSWTESESNGEKCCGNQKDGRTDTDMWFVVVSPISWPKPYKSMSSGLPFMCPCPKGGWYHLRHRLPNLFAPSSMAQQNLTSLHIHQNQVSSPRVSAYVNVRLYLRVLCLCAHIQYVNRVFRKWLRRFSRSPSCTHIKVTRFISCNCLCRRSVCVRACVRAFVHLRKTQNVCKLTLKKFRFTSLFIPTNQNFSTCVSAYVNVCVCVCAYE